MTARQPINIEEEEARRKKFAARLVREYEEKFADILEIRETAAKFGIKLPAAKRKTGAGQNGRGGLESVLAVMDVGGEATVADIYDCVHEQGSKISKAGVNFVIGRYDNFERVRRGVYKRIK